MLTLYSFLQSVFQAVKGASARCVPVAVRGISVAFRCMSVAAGCMFTASGRRSRRLYHRMEVVLAGAVMVALMTFTLNGFAGGGRSALTVYAETPQAEMLTVQEPEVMEAAMSADTKVQVRFTDAENLREGQALAGNTLAEDIRRQEAARDEIRAVVEIAKDEIRKAKEQGAADAGDDQSQGTVQTAAVPCSQQDYEVLKRIVQAEAGICDTKGRILVANVVLNRVRSGQFPNTITEVVYQKSQFSPVRDGRLNSCVVTAETVEAVDRALAGEDYSQGELYFMNRGRSRARNVSWFDRNLTYLFHHDQHEFFK